MSVETWLAPATLFRKACCRIWKHMGAKQTAHAHHQDRQNTQHRPPKASHFMWCHLQRIITIITQHTLGGRLEIPLRGVLDGFAEVKPPSPSLHPHNTPEGVPRQLLRDFSEHGTRSAPALFQRRFLFETFHGFSGSKNEQSCQHMKSCHTA